MEIPLKIFHIPTKRTDSPNFAKVLLKFVKKQYGDSERQKYQTQITNMLKTRQSFVNVQNGENHQKFLDYAQLIDYAGLHFPINGGTKKRIKIAFTWYDSLSRRKVTNMSTTWESCNCIFVAASLITQQACQEPRTTPESALKAAKLFKLAAGLFEYLKEERIPKLLGKTTVDLHSETLQVISDICLAHAHQCVLMKAILGKMKRPLLSMLAFELSAMWKDIHGRIGSSTISECFNIDWKTMASFKHTYYAVYGHYLLGIENYEKTEVGIALARINEAKRLLGLISKLKLNSAMKKHWVEFSAIVSKKQEDVKSDNEKVYYETVPSLSSLGENKRKKIVKCEEVDIDKLAPLKDPFKSLFPLHVMEAVKKYSSMVTQKVNIGLRNAQLHREKIKNTLSQYGLPGSVLAEDTTMKGFPDAVHNKISAINKSGGVKKLSNFRQTLRNMAGECTKLCNTVLKMLSDEEADDMEMRRQYGIRWNRLPSVQLTMSMKKQLNECIAKVNQAAQADGMIDKKLKSYDQYFQRFQLTRENLDATLPKSVESNTGTTKVAAQIRKLCESLDALFAKEIQVGNSLKNLQSQEDVNELFLSSQDVNNEITIQLGKFDVKLKNIATLSQQEDQMFQNILNSNQYYLNMKKQKSSQPTKRAQHIQTMYFAINKYDEILGNINQGLHFYSDMQTFVGKLKAKVKDFVFTRGIEMKDIISNLSKQLNYVPQNYGMGFGNNQNQNQRFYQPQYGNQNLNNQNNQYFGYKK